MDPELEAILEELRKTVRVDSSGIPRLGEEADRILDRLKEIFVRKVVGGPLREAEEWLDHVRRAVEELRSLLGLAGFTYPREFGSFIQDPLEHLKKKLFNYAYDLARGRMTLEEFEQRAAAAVRTSLRTNMRTAYQIWGLTTIMALLARRGFRLEYPEHGFLNFDRSGKQRLGIIPPNAVLVSFERGYLSFFHEAPRPLGWEDTSDLKRVWSLYTALRPDAMVYGGKVLNMVDLSSSPPIKRPNVILEFKELDDWYVRVRDLKGYFRKPLTAEEWRSKWLEGLFEGLADIMGVKRTEVGKHIEEARSLRVREYQLVKLYKATYKPDRMILVSRAPVPADVRKSLEDDGIEVVDGVGFDPSKLEPVADALEEAASWGGEERAALTLGPRTLALLKEAMRVLGVRDPEEVIRLALESVLRGAKEGQSAKPSASEALGGQP